MAVALLTCMPLHAGRPTRGRDVAGAEPVHLVGASPGQADSSAAVAVDLQQAVDGDRGVQFAADRRASRAQRPRTAAWNDKSAIHPVGLMLIANRQWIRTDVEAGVQFLYGDAGAVQLSTWRRRSRAGR